MSRNDPTIYLGDLSIVAGLTHDGDRQALDILRDIDPDNYQVRTPWLHGVMVLTMNRSDPYTWDQRILPSSPNDGPQVQPRTGRSNFWAGMIK